MRFRRVSGETEGVLGRARALWEGGRGEWVSGGREGVMGGWGLWASGRHAWVSYCYYLLSFIIIFFLCVSIFSVSSPFPSSLSPPFPSSPFPSSSISPLTSPPHLFYSPYPLPLSLFSPFTLPLFTHYLYYPFLLRRLPSLAPYKVRTLGTLA